MDPVVCKSPQLWDIPGDQVLYCTVLYCIVLYCTDIPGDQICAHGDTAAPGGCVADSCSGDSGGGLLADSAGRATLVGRA